MAVGLPDRRVNLTNHRPDSNLGSKARVAVVCGLRATRSEEQARSIFQLLARGTAEIEAGVGRDLHAVMADADDLLGQM